MAKKATKTTEEVVTAPMKDIPFILITMPYVVDGIETKVEWKFSQEAINETSKYIKYNDGFGYFTR